MKINIEKIITTTNEALNDLKYLDASNWSKEEKQEVQTSVEEVIKLGLLARWKVQKVYLEQFVGEMDDKIKALNVSELEQTTKSLEGIISDIKQLNIDIDKVAA